MLKIIMKYYFNTINKRYFLGSIAICNSRTIRLQCLKYFHSIFDFPKESNRCLISNYQVHLKVIFFFILTDNYNTIQIKKFK